MEATKKEKKQRTDTHNELTLTWPSTSGAGSSESAQVAVRATPWLGIALSGCPNCCGKAHHPKPPKTTKKWNTGNKKHRTNMLGIVGHTLEVLQRKPPKTNKKKQSFTCWALLGTHSSYFRG